MVHYSTKQAGVGSKITMLEQIPKAANLLVDAKFTCHSYLSGVADGTI